MLFVHVILPVFIIVLAGYALQRRARLDLRPLTECSLYLFTPALVFSALLRRELHPDLVGQLTLFMIAYTAAMTALAVLMARTWCLDGNAGRALVLTTAMMNVGNFGLPLVMFAYGAAALDVSILTFVLFNIPLGTLAIVVAQGNGTGWGEAVCNALRIPIFHAVLLALLCKGVGWLPPEFILRPTELVGQAAVPVMLVLLGMQLARAGIGRGWVFCGAATVLRLAVAPLMAIGLTALFGIDGLARKVLILQTSTPAAVLTLLYAVRFNTKPELVAGTIFLSTLASALSLTVLLYWLG